MARLSARTLAIHVTRIAVATAICILALLAVMVMLRFVSGADRFAWYGLPLSIAAGYAALWRWYPRDAYPIGLAFCPAMFFFLRVVYEWARPWFWPNAIP